MRIDAPSVRRGWLALLLSLALVRGLICLSVIPPWQSPDETGHFEYAWLVAHLGRLPAASDLSPFFERELLGSLYEWRYGDLIKRPLPEQMPARIDNLPPQIFARMSRTAPGRFSLSYLWMALWIGPVGHQDLAVQLYAARLSSVFLQLGIIWLAWRILSQVYPSRAGPVLAMTALIVFIPQHTLINSTVGDGTLAELMACLVLYGWVRVFSRGWGYWEAAWIVLGTVAGLWSKKTAVFLLPLDAALMGWWLFRLRRWGWTRRQSVYVALGAAALILAGWLVARSSIGTFAFTYLGDHLSLEMQWVDPRGLTLGDGLLASYDSFWANFGWMVVPASPRWYGAILLVTVAAVLGWVTRGRAAELPRWTVGMMGASLLASLVVFVWVALLFPAGGYYQFQGRYLYPVIVPFAFLLVEGWMRIAPAGRRPMLMWAGVICVILFDAWYMLGTVVPYFYLN
jgi:Predicted membrane protein (DUF2142)